MKARREHKQKAVEAKLEAVREQIKQQREAETLKPAKEPRSASSGGYVLAENVNEPLDAIMKAFEARLANRQTPELRWLTHPYPQLERQRLEMCKQLI